MQYTKQFELKQSQYISEIASQIDISSGIILIESDVGTGKSVYAAQQKNSRFGVPLTCIRDSIDGDIETWNKLVKDIIETKDKSVFKEETLFIDEVHGLLIDDYKSTLIAELIKCFKYFKSVVLLSGTVKADYFSSFKIDRAYRVKKPSVAKKIITQYVASNTKAFLTDEIVNCTTKAIALINDIDLCHAIKARAEQNGLSVLVVNADVKDTKAVKDFYKSKAMVCENHQYDIILGTDSIREGLSIEDTLDEVTVYIYGHRDPDEIEQFTNRFRNVTDKKNVVYITSPRIEMSLKIDSTEEIYAKSTKAAAALTDIYYNVYDSDFMRDKFTNTYKNEFNGSFIFFSQVSKEFKVNSIAIDFEKARQRKEQSANDLITFCGRMQEYEFTVDDIINIDGDSRINDDLNTELKASKEEREAIRAEQLQHVKVFFETGQVLENPATNDYNSAVKAIQRLLDAGLRHDNINAVVDGLVNDKEFIAKVWNDFCNYNKGNRVLDFIQAYIDGSDKSIGRLEIGNDGWIGSMEIKVFSCLLAKFVCRDAFGDNVDAMVTNSEWKRLVYKNAVGGLEIRERKARSIISKFITLTESTPRKVKDRFTGKIVTDRVCKIAYLSLTNIQQYTNEEKINMFRDLAAA